MTARDGLFVNGSGGVGQTSPTEARIAMAGLIAAGAGGIDVRGGVEYGPGTPLQVTGTSATSPPTYQIAAGNAIINRSTALGPYALGNDGTVTVNTTIPGTASRWDLIWIRQPDAEQGDGGSAATFGVTSGTAAASPTKPTAPAGTLVLAESLIASTATTTLGATITQVAPYTVARGATVPVRNSTERAALTQFPGLEVFRLDTLLKEISDGSSWSISGALAVAGQTLPMKLAGGSQVITTSTGGEVNITTGLSSIVVFLPINGDGIARTNVTMGMNRSGLSGGTVRVKCWDAGSGATINSTAIRFDWLALGT